MRVYNCYGCTHAFADPDIGFLVCEKRMPGCPEVGDDCAGFERYPGAETAADMTDETEASA